MPFDWTEVNERRISEKTQEILLYCAQKSCDMTPHSFELARVSLSQLLDNMIDRDKKEFSGIYESVRRGMEYQNNCVAICSEKQAACMARSVVYGYMGDDLNLYPITAEQKLQRAKVRGLTTCDIPKDEMTDKDMVYIVYAFTQGESLSKNTMIAAFEWFKQFGFDPSKARVYATYRYSFKPLNIKSIPQYSMFIPKYRFAVRSLIEEGYLLQVDEDVYEFTGKKLESDTSEYSWQPVDFF